MNCFSVCMDLFHLHTDIVGNGKNHSYYFPIAGPRRESGGMGARNTSDTISITSSVAAAGSSNGPSGGVASSMFAKPPLPSPNNQHLPNSKSVPALHHVGNICKI